MVNSHTHIFTIDHVPNRFAKGLFFGGRLITIKFAKAIWPLIARLIKAKANFRYKYKTLNGIIIFLLKWPLGWFLRRIGIKSSLSLPGKETQSMLRRYIRMVEYAYSLKGKKTNKQIDIFERLRLYYSSTAKFVALSMDMEFMGAGDPIQDYGNQCSELEGIKKGTIRGSSKGSLGAFIEPFLCVDPRRLTVTGNKKWTYADYFKKLAMVVPDTNEKVYSGIKIYPSLGYYPFDWRLIPIYAYALKNNIPIMTHCSHGSVYYRGKWDKKKHGLHPFGGIPLWKRTKKGRHIENFTVNFGNPLNYLVITDQNYLNDYLNNGVNKSLFTKNEQELWNEFVEPLAKKTPDLSNLRICLAHWGGGDEWDRYLEDHQFSSVAKPLVGLINNRAKFKKIWEEYSWFTIVRELLLDERFNFYTDISFTLHQEKYLNLLKVQLIPPKPPKKKNRIRERVLFGTDYYVVSYLETEREFSIDVRGVLGEVLWNQITVVNPNKYI